MSFCNYTVMITDSDARPVIGLGDSKVVLKRMETGVEYPLTEIVERAGMYFTNSLEAAVSGELYKIYIDGTEAKHLSGDNGTVVVVV